MYIRRIYIMARSMGGGRSGGSRGGGGRSMGGGSRSGSRSFSGGGRSRGSGGGGNRHIGGGGGYHSSGHHYHSSNHHHHHSYHRPVRHYHHYHGGRTYYRSSGGGCSSVLASFIIIAIVVFICIGKMGSGFGGSNQKLNRDKYNGPVDSSHGYYIDESEGDLKFIDRSNESTLISGFKNFYNKTGVFPFLYIIEDTPSKSEYEGYDTYQDMLYEKLFDAEGNFLILYVASEEDYYFAAGYDTGEIIDETSLDIICDKVNGYWYTGDLAKAFGDGLEDAAKNIMAKSNFRAIMTVLIIAVAVIIIVVILFKWWKKKKEQENKEQQDLEKILSTPLETFGNDMSELTKKYDEPQQ